MEPVHGQQKSLITLNPIQPGDMTDLPYRKELTISLRVGKKLTTDDVLKENKTNKGSGQLSQSR